MATPKQKLVAGQLKARVLASCSLGNCDDIVVIDEADIERLAGIVDADPGAVAYAESQAK